MKKTLETLFRLAICFALSFFLLHLTGELFDTTGMWYRHGDKRYLWYALTLVAFLISCVGLNYAGTLLLGRLTGWRLAEMSFLGLGLHRNEAGRLRLMRRRPLAPILFLMTPPHLDGSSPFAPMLLGHAALAVPVSVTAIAVSIALRRTPEMLYLFIFGSFLLGATLLRLVSDTLPFLKRCRGNIHLRRALEQRNLSMAANRQGLSIVTLPDACGEPFPEEAWTEPQVFASQQTVVSRMLMQGQYSQAHAQFRRMLDFLPRPELPLPGKELHSRLLTINGAIAEMMCGVQPALSRRLPESAMDDAARRVRGTERLLLARYIRALLITRNEEEAQTLLASLEKVFSTMPVKSLDGLRRILNDAQTLAAEAEKSHT